MKHNTSPVRQWSAFLGDQPVLLVRNADVARRSLLQALHLRARDHVLVPANATHALVEAIRANRSRLRFGDLDDKLNLCSNAPARVAWAEPMLGLPGGIDVTCDTAILDHSRALPQGPVPVLAWADVVIFGLQLASCVDRAGALLVFRSVELASRVDAMLAPGDRLDPDLVLLQLARLQLVTPRQVAALEMVRTGVREAAGLLTLTPSAPAALARGVAVQIPAESTASTFVTYARHENTPLAWLPEVRPLHYGGARCQAAAATLERWLLLPVDPNTDLSMVKQTVLGVVKTAEYLGVRWRTDPARARQYADLMTNMYGPDHDAFRPVFDIGSGVHSLPRLDPMDLTTPACRIGHHGDGARMEPVLAMAA